MSSCINVLIENHIFVLCFICFFPFSTVLTVLFTHWITVRFADDPDSATSQFFISLQDNGSLDGDNQNGYAVFGKVVAGMNAVEQIGTVQTKSIGSFDDVPESVIEIVSIENVACPQ